MIRHISLQTVAKMHRLNKWNGFFFNELLDYAILPVCLLINHSILFKYINGKSIDNL